MKQHAVLVSSALLDIIGALSAHDEMLSNRQFAQWELHLSEESIGQPSYPNLSSRSL